MNYGKEESLLSNSSKCGGVLLKVTIPTLKKLMIGPKMIDCIFIGYAQNSSAYRFLVQKF